MNKYQLCIISVFKSFITVFATFLFEQKVSSECVVLVTSKKGSHCDISENFPSGREVYSI